MGFIADLARGKGVANYAAGVPQDGRRLWRQAFGTDKESGPAPARPEPAPGGSWARGITSSDASQVRLIQALRSKAPGGWSDDRWMQTMKGFTGLPYLAIHRAGMQLRKSTFKVFRKDPNHPDGKRPVTRDDPAYRLHALLERPNPQDDFGDLMYADNQQLDLTGTSLKYMVPNAYDPHSPRGQSIVELYPIPTAIAIPQPQINPDYPDGFYRIQPVYPYGPFSTFPTPASAVGAAIGAQWMIRCKYQHPLLRYDGFSPLTGLSKHIDALNAMDDSRTYKMRGSLNPSAVVNMKDVEGMESLPEPEIQRFRADMENEMQGPENHGRVLFAPPGGSIEEWGSTPADMDYQNGWDQLSSFVLGGLGMTKPGAGMVEDSAYANFYAALKQLSWANYGPKCDLIGAKYTRHLAPFFGDDLIVEVSCPSLDDHEIVFKLVDTLAAIKGCKKNEARRILSKVGVHLPPTDEEWGNDIVGDPSPKEEKQQKEQAEAQAEQAAQMGEEGPGGKKKPGAGGPPDQAKEVEASRPKPGQAGPAPARIKAWGVLGRHEQKHYDAVYGRAFQNGFAD